METFKDLADFEEKKHFDFFLPYYKSQKWEVLQDNLGQNTDWDIKLLINGQEYMIDEKARQRDYGDFLIEIVQDLKTGHVGWLFKPKDYYFYASWKSDTPQPNSFYTVDSKELQKFVVGNWKKLLGRMEISEKGWGTTLFAKIYWEDLLFTKIATKLI